VRRDQGHHLTGFCVHGLRRTGGRDGHRQDDTDRAGGVERPQPGTRRHTRCQPVVDEHHAPPGHLGQGPVSPVQADPPPHLGTFPFRHGGHIRCGQAERVEQPGVIDRLATFRDGAHAQLRLRRVPDLPGHQDVHRGMQPRRDLHSDGDTATRQGKNHRPFGGKIGQPVT
jgi:hypothetical protein